MEKRGIARVFSLKFQCKANMTRKPLNGGQLHWKPISVGLRAVTGGGRLSSLLPMPADHLRPEGPLARRPAGGEAASREIVRGRGGH